MQQSIVSSVKRNIAPNIISSLVAALITVPLALAIVPGQARGTNVNTGGGQVQAASVDSNSCSGSPAVLGASTESNEVAPPVGGFGSGVVLGENTTRNNTPHPGNSTVDNSTHTTTISKDRTNVIGSDLIDINDNNVNVLSGNETNVLNNSLNNNDVLSENDVLNGWLNGNLSNNHNKTTLLGIL
jgi:hypothetical protein